jgi:hypothetical protein
LRQTIATCNTVLPEVVVVGPGAGDGAAAVGDVGGAGGSGSGGADCVGAGAGGTKLPAGCAGDEYPFGGGSPTGEGILWA